MRKNKLVLTLIILTLLTGCWDERLLKDVRIVYLSGFDLDEKGDYLITVLIRNLNISKSSRGERSITNDMITGKGKNVRETSLNIDQSVAGTLDPAKGRTLILGNDIAKGDIFNVLDTIYREPRLNVNSKVVVTSGSAKNLIQHLTEKEMEKAEYFYELIKSSEDLTEIPSVTVQTVCTYLFDEGKDFFLPYLGIDKEDHTVKVKGTVLFHDRSFTGQYLSIDESKLLLLFMDKKARKAILTDRVEQQEDAALSYKVKRISRNLKVTKKDKVSVDISLQLDVEVIDYPTDHLDNQKKIKDLNQQLSRQLTKNADALFKKLADNQSDVLGLGRELIAFYPSIWEEIKGKNYYEHIEVNPEVNINIISRGIIL
ncbi:Ger(x)C family spore germination protein [Bacillus sp. ISL-4]|uniref:Ger(x)C family spore germination protein n=1 Tax=Bacillus sp. ISL-4 TaxID=2819125 RepID=UPI001BE89640|nr:Ger(x)C family spore germination protein [Bacillus sp. ISL-4]MBT2668509.1 Ger(x)C family spore germination protein [Bacillus sp. ISL-4]MBT2675064.1 Ger(x)C family spore germination protein [Streptomyces sp. ISL-14]